MAIKQIRKKKNQRQSDCLQTHKTKLCQNLSYENNLRRMANNQSNNTNLSIKKLQPFLFGAHKKATTDVKLVAAKMSKHRKIRAIAVLDAKNERHSRRKNTIANRMPSSQTTAKKNVKIIITH